MAVQERNVSGSFTATGQSNGLKTGGKTLVCLNFAGTASIDLECRPEGTETWFKVKTYVADIVELAGEENLRNIIEYRLNCTAHTDDVDYALGA